jgi:hypothetical protein
LILAAGAFLAALNLAVITFYLLYRVADMWADNRSEDHGVFDPSYLLPNDVTLWLIASATVVLLFGVDIVAVLVGIRLRRLERSRSALQPASGL